MATLSRRLIFPPQSRQNTFFECGASKYVCARCLQFSTAPELLSGHNRWSKIKHEKGSADQKKTAQRTQFAQQISMMVKMHGPDPNINPRLAAILAAAKKAGFPKSAIEAALARGRGVSSSGATLESITLEVIGPSSVAMVIEAETDNKARSLMELRLLIKNHKGTVTPTSYLFQKQGRVVLENDDRGLGIDEVLDDAIECGAQDVETDEDGSIVVWTEPSSTITTANALEKSLGLKAQASEIVWAPNKDTETPLNTVDDVDAIFDLISALKDNSDVQGVYVNAAQGEVDDETWSQLQSKIAL